MAGGSPVDLAPSRDYGNEPHMAGFVKKIKTLPLRGKASPSRATLSLNAPLCAFSATLAPADLDKADVVIDGMTGALEEAEARCSTRI
jgi:hypothetical protein